MKAILLSRTGGPPPREVLEYREVPTPRPGDGEVLVRADTIGVSIPEVLVRKGAYVIEPLRIVIGVHAGPAIVGRWATAAPAR